MRIYLIVNLSIKHILHNLRNVFHHGFYNFSKANLRYFCNFSKYFIFRAPKIEGLPLVAHNSHFDEGCLKEVFQVYQMDYPDYEFLDTLSASRRHFNGKLPNYQLQTVAAVCGYDLTNHHHALADAEACAHIALEIL